MGLKEKYANVLLVGEKIGVVNGKVEEFDGVLHIWGTVEFAYQKDQLWDAIKAAGGTNPSDIAADIIVISTEFYAIHTVATGENLNVIAKHYYGDSMKYKLILEANRNQMDDLANIVVGQVLVIPNE